jgi:hypothetical protein
MQQTLCRKIMLMMLWKPLRLHKLMYLKMKVSMLKEMLLFIMKEGQIIVYKVTFIIVINIWPVQVL